MAQIIPHSTKHREQRRKTRFNQCINVLCMVGYQFAVPRYLFGCGSRQPGLIIRSYSLLNTKRGAKSAAQFHTLRLRKVPTLSERATTKPHEDVYIKSLRPPFGDQSDGYSTPIGAFTLLCF